MSRVRPSRRHRRAEPLTSPSAHRNARLPGGDDARVPPVYVAAIDDEQQRSDCRFVAHRFSSECRGGSWQRSHRLQMRSIADWTEELTVRRACVPWLKLPKCVDVFSLGMQMTVCSDRKCRARCCY